MRIKFVAGIAGVLLLFGITSVSQAALVKIGQGIHWDGINGVTTNNLIWDTDTDLNGDSLIWLDYSAPKKNWDDQRFWAQGLNTMVITLGSGYTVEWGTNSWRLPSAGENPQFGYNQTGSEMGHLYYTELGNSARVLTNTGEFQNLIEPWYWSGTELAHDTNYAWNFYWWNPYGYDGDGYQRDYTKNLSNGHGLAVRSGQVSAVPVPGAFLLLGTGLLGLSGINRRKK